MNIIVKLMFLSLFWAMGLSIVGAGIKGQPATAVIVITIGFLMVTIGIAPFTVPLIYKYYVDPKIKAAEAQAS